MTAFRLPKIDARQQRLNSVAALLLVCVAEPLSKTGPWAVLWTTPCVLAASLLMTWGAESAQFFVGQGFALAILAWMQTLPEFAVEAVLAWKQQTCYLRVICGYYVADEEFLPELFAHVFSPRSYFPVLA